MSSQLTMLNSMAAPDLETQLARHKEWGVGCLDLRDAVFGKRLEFLTVEEAGQARDLIEAAGLDVYCFSVPIYNDQVEKGEAAFRGRFDPMTAHVLELAAILRPKLIRLIAAQLPSREAGQDSVELLRARHGWIFDGYRRTIDTVAEAGFRPVIENESNRCFLSRTSEFVDFFTELDRTGTVGLTWDVQNQWATGVFPSLESYEALKPHLVYYHAKGGQRAGAGDDRLAWNVALEEADWPVVDLTRRVVEDGTSPVICLNPPQHGEDKPGYDYGAVTKRDLDYLRANVPDLR